MNGTQPQKGFLFSPKHGAPLPPKLCLVQRLKHQRDLQPESRATAKLHRCRGTSAHRLYQQVATLSFQRGRPLAHFGMASVEAPFMTESAVLKNKPAQVAPQRSALGSIFCPSLSPFATMVRSMVRALRSSVCGCATQIWRRQQEPTLAMPTLAPPWFQGCCPAPPQP